MEPEKKEKKQPVRLHLVGPAMGGPSFEDILNLFRQVTGREPSEEEVEEARKEWEA